MIETQEETAIRKQRESVRYLQDEWTPLLHVDCEKEKLNEDWPIFTSNFEIRSALWSTCRKLKILEKDVAAQAARLLDCYLSFSMRASFHTYPDQDPHYHWKEFQASMAGNMAMIILVCIRISYKVLINKCRTFLLTDKMVIVLHKMLKHSEIDTGMTADEINITEFRILSNVGHCIPIWTSLQTATYISQIIDFTQDYTLVIDYSELVRAEIEEKVRAAGGLRPQDKGTLRTLPLCAGIVLMMARRSTTQCDRALDIARVTQLPAEMVTCVCDAASETIWNHFS